MGRFIASAPVAGSVTFAEFTSHPPCVERAPFILIRPSGPRTTPGTRGSRLSTFSLVFGAASTVAWVMVVDCADCSDTADTADSVAVTVTELVTAVSSSGIAATAVSPAATSTESFPARPGAVASAVYRPGGKSSKRNWPVASDSVWRSTGPLRLICAPGTTARCPSAPRLKTSPAIDPVRRFRAPERSSRLTRGIQPSMKSAQKSPSFSQAIGAGPHSRLSLS